MPDQNAQRLNERASRKRDIPHLIKWIILIILLILLFLELYSGEYKRLFDQNQFSVWLVVFIKIILIIGIIILMRVQRSLKAEIISPNGCTEETPDTTQGILFVTVKGTASGAAFGYYSIEIQKNGDPPYPSSLISYPGGGSNGTSPVLNGELAKINTTSLSDGAYTITLRVFSSGSGPAAVATKTFNLLKVAVWINSVNGIAPTPNIFDEEGMLISGGNELSFGGSLALLGSAFIYECNDRKVLRVEMRQAAIPVSGPVPMQPANNTAVPAAWPAANQLASPLIYDPSKYYPWTKIGMAPTYLLNTWGTCTVFGTTYPSLAAQNWYSRNATGGGADGGDYFKLLLITEDTGGFVYYDTQKIWIDNHQVRAKIVKFQREENGVWIDLPHCTDIMISWGKLRIVGIAWDALINPLYPVARPNDNFASYGLSYAKQFVGGSLSIAIAAPTERVPNTIVYPISGASVTPPADADADVLAEWNLNTLDAGTKPTGVNGCPDPTGNEHSLYRGCECTYNLTLSVSDYTVGNETGVHNTYDSESMKIINDL